MTTFCPACGNGVTAEDKFCRSCGAPTSAAAGPASVLPPVPAGPVETSGKAITSLVCGLMFFIPFAFVAAVIFGHLALSEIKKSAGRLKGDGLAIAGLVLGYMWVVSIPVVLIIAAIAIPNLLRAKMAANESSSVASMRTITTAQITYTASHNGYACSLSDLGGGDQLIDRVLASGQKSGYTFEITACAPGPDGAANQMYQVTARPITPNTTGVRSFCSDESAVIRIDPGGSGTCAERGQPLQ